MLKGDLMTSSAIRYLSVALCTLVLVGSVATAQGDPFASPEKPQAVANALEQYSGTPFTASGDSSGVKPGVDIVKMMYECQQPFGQIKDGTLFIHGFDYVDTNVYRLQGPRALGSAETAARMRALGAAAGFINGLHVWSAHALQDQNTTQSAGQAVGAGPDAQLQASVSTSTMQKLSNVTATEAQAYIKGGHTVGLKVIGLGKNGFCVVVRYAIPLNQGKAAAPERGQAGEAGVTDGSPPSSTSGYPVPPPSSSGNF